jgi:hypothetical protein
MRENTALADRHRSYPYVQGVVGMDDIATDELSAAARELEAHLLFEHARRLGDVRDLLAELYQRDGVAVDDAMLDTQAEEVAAQERAERFLQEIATRLHPGAKLLEVAAGLDDHTLGVWREAAYSLMGACPPWLAHLRWRVEEEQRGELRSHAHLVRSEGHLAALLRRFGLAGRLWHRHQVAELRSKLADCRTQRGRSERRLAFLDAKLQVIQRVEQARAAWITQACEVLARGLAAIQILTEREQRSKCGDPPWPAKPDQMRQGMVS